MLNYLETEQKEYQHVGSLNHSLIQARLARLLPDDDSFTIAIELSLDVSQTDLSQFGLKVKEELKPDILLYEESYQPNPLEDIVKMTKMPSLIIEILSPSQGFSDILAKFKAYFALGVKSCWLVTPALESIAVYSGQTYKPFDLEHDTEIIDEVLNLRLPIQKIFRK
jgi:Uma2 family endonuclease